MEWRKLYCYLFSTISHIHIERARERGEEKNVERVKERERKAKMGGVGRASKKQAEHTVKKIPCCCCCRWSERVSGGSVV
jgi:hypothetical protein